MSTKNGVRGINYTNSNSKWNTSNKNKEQRKKIILARWLGEGLVECQIGETYHFISAIKNDEVISEIKYSNGIELRNIHRREIRMIISSKYITYPFELSIDRHLNCKKNRLKPMCFYRMDWNMCVMWVWVYN